MMGRKLISTLIAVLLCACARETSASLSEPSFSPETAAGLFSSVMPEYDTLSKEALIQLLQLDSGTVESASAALGRNGSPEMIIAVKSVTEQDALKATEKLSYYAETLKNTAGLYNPGQLSLLENAWTYTDGTYSFLIISSSADDLKAALIQSLETAGK